MIGHPPLERLEAETLSAEDAMHLASCPRCRIDRRMLRESAAEVAAPDLDLARLALEGTRAEASDSLAASWRSSRSETEGMHRTVATDDLLPAGTRLGNYRIDGLLGRGGMAVVYRVVHVELGTRSALKVLTARGATLRARLLREGRLQGRLRHRNIVGVTDVVEQDSAPALILEYVPGPSLDRVLRDCDLSLDEADAIAVDILTGVAAAHARGFVHRDLKPSNVLVDPTGDTVVAKVADFGLAKALGPEPLDHLQTRSGNGMLGTLLYMAPEQIRDPRDADARSDVFALGALLYELVSGQRCFAGVDLVDIVARLAAATRAPLPGHVPIRMARAIDAALDVDPVRRPDSADALLELWTDGRDSNTVTWSRDRLDRLAELHTVTLLPESADELADEAPSRLPLWLSAAAALVIGLLGAGAVAWLWPAAPPGAAAVMLVHQLPGAPGRGRQTSLTAVFAEDLGGLYTAACLHGRSGCAAAVPEPDAWVPLVEPPPSSALRTEISDLSFAGIDAFADEGVYGGIGQEYTPGAEPRLRLDSSEVVTALRLPSLPALRTPATRPLTPAEGEAVRITWEAGGGGAPFLEVRPRGGVSGRLYRLVDDGSFEVPAELFPPGPSQTDLVFGRTAQTSVDVGGTPTTVVARTQQWLTVVRVEPGRTYLDGIGVCEETKVRPPLEPGRYWMLLDYEYDDTSQVMQWPCWPREVTGIQPVYPVAVAAGARRAVRVETPQGDPFLWLSQNPYCLEQNCLGTADRPGTSEVILLEPPGDGAFVFNVGLVDADRSGGLALIDVVELGRPEDQTVTLTWVDDASPGHDLEVNILGAADVEYRLGLAETQSPNGWYGEDCLHGSTREGLQQCHDMVGDGLTLSRVEELRRVRSGETTLFWPAVGRLLTGYLEARNLQREDGRPWCWTWGPTPEYYASRDCQVLPWEPPKGWTPREREPASP